MYVFFAFVIFVCMSARVYVSVFVCDNEKQRWCHRTGQLTVECQHANQEVVKHCWAGNIIVSVHVISGSGVAFHENLLWHTWHSAAISLLLFLRYTFAGAPEVKLSL